MAFANGITRVPRPYELDRAEETSVRFSGLPPEVVSLLSGAAGCSPYLRSLMEREAEWLEDILQGEPESAFAGIIADVNNLDTGTLSHGLRSAKRRVALLTALADLGGIWPLEKVTGALTEFADLSVDRAIRSLVALEASRGKIPGFSERDAESGAGMVALAMGKMGASELNYSSDIDLICLFEESRFDAADYLDARSAFIRVTRKMTTILSEISSDGYVFRIDLRLRPDAAVTPVCISMEAAERYYESVGRTWERAAYIKARAAGGDIEAGQGFLQRLTPFVWRRHLDFSAIQDAHDMRLRIREHKTPGTGRTLEGLDLKLAPGGIREIEFYTQTRQIIAGGRDPELRLRGTVPALQALNAKGWADESDVLIDDYRAHREVEHRLQMIADQQTHSLPAKAEGFERLAALMDCDVDALRSDLQERIARVSAITEGFFAPGTVRAAPELSAASAEIVARWPSYPALRSARAAEIFERVKPEILRRLDRAAQPEEALVHIDGFLAGLPAGVQLFSMFDTNPHLIDLIVDIAASSRELAAYLSRHSEVLDAVIDGAFFSDWPGESGLRKTLAAAIAAAPDYETALLVARQWRNEWHFRVGVHHLRGLVTSAEAGREYADIAGAVLWSLWLVVESEFAEKHGTPPGRGAALLGMGSIGSRRLTAVSDLDLIVVYDPDGVDASDGRRPLASRAYYARLTQAFVTALSARMGPGKLYEVDMRLRPSGRQGPVATSLSSFKTYQREEAWTWEHLALTRARHVAGSDDLGAELETFRCELIEAPRDRSRTLADVRDMRARLERAQSGQAGWDAKLGRGRLQDIALIAQAGALLAGSPARDVSGQIDAGSEVLSLKPEDAGSLKSADSLFWGVQAASRLITAGSLEADEIGEGARQFLLREAGAKDMPALASRLDKFSHETAEIIDGVLATRESRSDG